MTSKTQIHNMLWYKIRCHRQLSGHIDHWVVPRLIYRHNKMFQPQDKFDDKMDILWNVLETMIIEEIRHGL